MVLKSDTDKITFIVDTLCSIGFEHKGASIAVHMLAYKLADMGHYVYVFNEPFYPHENIMVIPTKKFGRDGNWWAEFSWESFSFDITRTVSIYTQITWGNPLNTKYNCRWILHDYDEHAWETYDENDVIYNYGSFKIPEGIRQEKLTVFDYKLDLYKNMGGDRNGFCHIIHKFTPEWGYDFLKNFDSKDLTNLLFKGEFNELAREFNQFEYLITFDDKSYITTAAALCGCKVIILNRDKEITPLEYRLQNPIQMCGVAYGWGDISWANQTIGFVGDTIKQLEQSDNKTVDLFIEFWKTKLML